MAYTCDRKYDEALSHAEGMGRREAARHARQAFRHANQCLVQQAPRTCERDCAIEAALAWRNVLRYFTRTRAPVFRQADYTQWQRTPREILRLTLAPVDPRRRYFVRRLMQGNKPVTWSRLPPEPAGKAPART